MRQQHPHGQFERFDKFEAAVEAAAGTNRPAQLSQQLIHMASNETTTAVDTGPRHNETAVGSANQQEPPECNRQELREKAIRRAKRKCRSGIHTTAVILL